MILDGNFYEFKVYKKKPLLTSLSVWVNLECNEILWF